MYTKRDNKIIRCIAIILAFTFILQDIVWANPEIISTPPSQSHLQIQPISTDISKIIEARVQGILLAGNGLPIEKIFGEFTQDNTFWIRNADRHEEIRIYFDPGHDRFKDRGIYIARFVFHCDTGPAEGVTFYGTLAKEGSRIYRGDRWPEALAALERATPAAPAPAGGTERSAGSMETSDTPAAPAGPEEGAKRTRESIASIHKAANFLGRAGMFVPEGAREPSITKVNRTLRKNRIFDSNFILPLAAGISIFLIALLLKSFEYRMIFIIVSGLGLLTAAIRATRAYESSVSRRNERVRIAIDELLEGIRLVEEEISGGGIDPELLDGLPIPVADKYVTGYKGEPLMGSVSDASIKKLIASSRRQLLHMKERGIEDGVLSFDSEGNVHEYISMTPKQEYEFLRSTRAGAPDLMTRAIRRFKGDIPFNGVELEAAKLYRALKLAEIIGNEAAIDMARNPAISAAELINSAKRKHRDGLDAMIKLNETLRARGSSAYQSPLIAFWAVNLAVIFIPVFLIYILAPYAILYINIWQGTGLMSDAFMACIRFYSSHSWAVTVFITGSLIVSIFNWLYKDIYVSTAALLSGRKKFNTADGAIVSRSGIVNVTEKEEAEFSARGHELPVYTIALPAFGEPDVIEELIETMSRIEYPKDKLDIILLPEAADSDARKGELISTLDLIRAKLSSDPERYSNFTVLTSQIRMLDEHNQAKPYSTNYLLGIMKGKYLVIYDAEDRPHPKQVLKAAIAFETRERYLDRIAGYFSEGGSVDSIDPELAMKAFEYRFDLEQLKKLVDDMGRQGAVTQYANRHRLGVMQAPLTWYNPVTLTATQFIVDYGYWFNIFLPGLIHKRLPAPCGGTSNHFAASAIKDVGGWDPHNVTEDAQIAVDIQREGYEALMLHSITVEEAPTRHVRPEKWDWIRQHSRWGKGYLQTFLVLWRHPARMYRSFGFRGFAALTMLFGIGTYSYLFNSLFVVNTILWGMSNLIIMGQAWSLAALATAASLILVMRGSRLHTAAGALTVILAANIFFYPGILSFAHYFSMLMPHALPVIPWIGEVSGVQPLLVGMIFMSLPVISHIFYSAASVYIGPPNRDFVLKTTIEELATRKKEVEAKDPDEAEHIEWIVGKLRGDPRFYKRTLYMAAILIPLYRTFSMLSFWIGYAQFMKGAAFYWDKTEHWGRRAMIGGKNVIRRINSVITEYHHRFSKIYPAQKVRFFKIEWGALAPIALTFIFILAAPIRYAKEYLGSAAERSCLLPAAEDASRAFFSDYARSCQNEEDNTRLSAVYYNAIKLSYARSPNYLKGRIESLMRDRMAGRIWNLQDEQTQLHILAYYELVLRPQILASGSDYAMMRFIEDLKILMMAAGPSPDRRTYLQRALDEVSGKRLPVPKNAPGWVGRFLRDTRTEINWMRIHLLGEKPRPDEQLSPESPSSGEGSDSSGASSLVNDRAGAGMILVGAGLAGINAMGSEWLNLAGAGLMVLGTVLVLRKHIWKFIVRIFRRSDMFVSPVNGTGYYGRRAAAGRVMPMLIAVTALTGVRAPGITQPPPTPLPDSDPALSAEPFASPAAAPSTETAPDTGSDSGRKQDVRLVLNQIFSGPFASDEINNMTPADGNNIKDGAREIYKRGDGAIVIITGSKKISAVYDPKAMWLKVMFPDNLPADYMEEVRAAVLRAILRGLKQTRREMSGGRGDIVPALSPAQPDVSGDRPGLRRGAGMIPIVRYWLGEERAGKYQAMLEQAALWSLNWPFLLIFDHTGIVISTITIWTLFFAAHFLKIRNVSNMPPRPPAVSILAISAINAASVIMTYSSPPLFYAASIANLFIHDLANTVFLKRRRNIPGRLMLIGAAVLTGRVSTALGLTNDIAAPDLFYAVPQATSAIRIMNFIYEWPWASGALVILAGLMALEAVQIINKRKQQRGVPIIASALRLAGRTISEREVFEGLLLKRIEGLVKEGRSAEARLLLVGMETGSGRKHSGIPHRAIPADEDLAKMGIGQLRQLLCDMRPDSFYRISDIIKLGSIFPGTEEFRAPDFDRAGALSKIRAEFGRIREGINRRSGSDDKAPPTEPRIGRLNPAEFVAAASLMLDRASSATAPDPARAATGYPAPGAENIGGVKSEKRPLNTPEDYARALVEWAKLPEGEARDAFPVQPVWSGECAMLGKPRPNGQGEVVTLTPEVMCYIEGKVRESSGFTDDWDMHSIRLIYSAAIVNVSGIDGIWKRQLTSVRYKIGMYLDFKKFIDDLSDEEKERFLDAAEKVYFTYCQAVLGLYKYFRSTGKSPYDHVFTDIFSKPPGNSFTALSGYGRKSKEVFMRQSREGTIKLCYGRVEAAKKLFREAIGNDATKSPVFAKKIAAQLADISLSDEGPQVRNGIRISEACVGVAGALGEGVLAEFNQIITERSNAPDTVPKPGAGEVDAGRDGRIPSTGNSIPEADDRAAGLYSPPSPEARALPLPTGLSTHRPAPGAPRMDTTSDRFLRGPFNEDMIMTNIVNGITSKVMTNKLVLVFDNKLGGSRRDELKKILQRLEDVMKDDENIFGRMWKGRLEIKESLADLKNLEDDRESEIFVFAQDTLKQRQEIAPARTRHVTFINEEDMSYTGYYPLFEIVMLALAETIDPAAIESVKPMMAEMNFAVMPRDEITGALVFRLLPGAVKLNTEEDIRARYRRLQEALIRA